MSPGLAPLFLVLRIGWAVVLFHVVPQWVEELNENKIRVDLCPPGFCLVHDSFGFI